jgi:hypothetical protein
MNITLLRKYVPCVIEISGIGTGCTRKALFSIWTRMDGRNTSAQRKPEGKRSQEALQHPAASVAESERGTHAANESIKKILASK